MLIGDAAGLAYPQSGEGIRPAIESGCWPRPPIVKARGPLHARRLEPTGAISCSDSVFQGWPGSSSHISFRITVAVALAPRLLEAPWFVRRVLLHRWFLHAHEPGIALAPA